ncbi:MAG: PhzF family phenazine biosynthesis protein [Dysgonamonadaceae bacterium]|jgi:PhzF family phenazine biosynthesis protein|nr:PhzF family phenazine biosynthesis protein [Dysgonamonadaceae bacterium]
MKKIKIYQVDAFTDRLFSGNPAAVCILDTWIDDELMQSIANENNLAETAFIVPNGQDFEIRWFTPTVEVDLCGHATLATAFVLFNMLNYPGSLIRFHSPRSGLLAVEKRDDMLFLDFPTDKLDELIEEQSVIIEKCIGIKPIESYKGKTDYIAVIDNESLLRTLQPDLTEISKLKARGLIVTAKGDDVDFVSRFFAPQSGINEDPVTGSAHTSLTPLWSKKLCKNKLIANQLSKRGGQLVCEFKNDRCMIGGKARLYLTGEIELK